METKLLPLPSVLSFHHRSRFRRPVTLSHRRHHCGKGNTCHISRQGCFSSSKSGLVVLDNRPSVSCSISMTDGQSDDCGNVNLEMIKKARKFWDELPQPIKSFPWNRVLDNFIQYVLEIVVAVIKYLSVPLLLVSSLSEMSYCAHERKLFLVPVPMVLGFAVAGILGEAVSELFPRIKVADVPWHWIIAAIFFTLLKFPGPYFPYWGRIFIPHFANGGLLRIFWMVFLWYRKTKEGKNAPPQQTAESLEQNRQ